MPNFRVSIPFWKSHACKWDNVSPSHFWGWGPNHRRSEDTDYHTSPSPAVDNYGLAIYSYESQFAILNMFIAKDWSARLK